MTYDHALINKNSILNQKCYKFVSNFRLLCLWILYSVSKSYRGALNYLQVLNLLKIYREMLQTF